jgi:hypothetical protein
LRWGELGGYVVAGAGLVAAVTIGLFFPIGQPWGTINDAALAVMTLALAPVMLASYELGGRTPLLPARLALAGGIASILAWCFVQAAMILGFVAFDYTNGATGAFAVESILVMLIGAWLIGAPLLAGPWLPSLHRWLGVVSGLGFIGLGLGLLLGGTTHPLTYLGGVGYQLAFPVWGYLMARRFGSLKA